MKRVGIFADVSNLYYCIRLKFKERKLDYKKYYNFCADLGEITQAVAYGAQVGTEALNFIHCLREVGFATKYKQPKSYSDGVRLKRKADWDVGIAIDIVSMADRLDLIVLGSADGDLSPVVSWARQRGIDVIVFGCGISRELKDVSTKYIEIPESLLEGQRDGAALSNRLSDRGEWQQLEGSEAGKQD